MTLTQRKNVSLDLKTYNELRKIAFNKGISVTQLIRNMLQTRSIAKST